mgnify:CR=1 FL=1|tara:strand:+ start:9372 stop:10175 length:804 start_codon:yes stop_codon:yes gene_type:complete
MKKSLLLISCCLLPLTAQAFTWQDLWQRPDQQAKHALAQDKPALAAQTFHDSQWQAYANYRAGEYEQAAQQFDSEDTPISNYNRGNALAQTGDFEAAIAAYDKALKEKPDFADAKHNRDLLKKLQQQQQNSPQQQNQRQQRQQNQQNNQQQSASGQQDQQQSAQNQQGDNPQQQSDQKQQQASQEKQPSDKQQQQADMGKDKQNQAGQDKQPGQQHADQQQGPSESQQATQQWLQGIPDNPGGLLQQKFLRDHQRYRANLQEGKSPW